MPIPPSITPETLHAIIADLTSKKLQQNQIAEKHGIHPSTVGRIRKRFIIVVKEEKKTITRGSESVEKFTAFKRKAHKIIADGLDELTPAKLKKCSAPQLVTAIAILVDKVKMLQDKMETVTSIRWESRAEMISYIQHGEEEPPKLGVRPVPGETQVQALHETQDGALSSGGSAPVQEGADPPDTTVTMPAGEQGEKALGFADERPPSTGGKGAGEPGEEPAGGSTHHPESPQAGKPPPAEDQQGGEEDRQGGGEEPKDHLNDRMPSGGNKDNGS